MYETLKKIYPEGPANRTDPILRHDSPYTAETIAMLYRPQREEGSDPGVPQDNVQRDAIHYPLIRVNNHILLEDSIVHFALHHDRFMPYIELTFRDTDNVVQFSDMPGLDNVVTVVMIENHPVAHRPVKLNFYVTECRIDGSLFYILAEFKCLPLEKQQFKQDVFHYPSGGCTAKWCQLGPNFHPTTYEFLHVIAENCGLGFSATQKCRSIKDDRFRLLKKEKYRDAAQEHTACGGLDENSIFDSWIDPWGTLVMVNLPWVMNEPVAPDELGSLITTSVETADAGSEGTKVTPPTMVHRILCNVSRVTGINNMMIKSIEKIVDLSSGYYSGTLTEYNTVQATGTDGGTNNLKTMQIQERENSKTAVKNTTDFEFHNQHFAGFEMSMLTPTVQQRHIHDEYFKQQRAHMFKATLMQPNFGLERGMLCMVLWFAQDPTQKAIILSQSPNLEEGGDGEQPRKTTDEDESIFNQYEPVMDTVLSGMYYIDGIVWEYGNDYDTEGNKIQQHLYLIKKGPVTQYYDKTGMIRFTQK